MYHTVYHTVWHAAHDAATPALAAHLPRLAENLSRRARPGTAAGPGLQALEQQTASSWWQLYIQFTDWNNAEQTAADRLAPLLRHAEEDGVVAAWWFMRKHPCWRLRLQPGPAGRTMKTDFGAAFDELAADGRIASWSPGIYETKCLAQRALTVTQRWSRGGRRHAAHSILAQCAAPRRYREVDHLWSCGNRPAAGSAARG